MGSSVLLLEDEPLIALDVEVTLRTFGYNIAATLSSCYAAAEWLASRSPDVAILDINLTDGACADVAQILADRDIPFIVHSGSLRSDELHAVFLGGHWVAKPALPEQLIEA